MGQTAQGTTMDDFAHVHPDVLAHYSGTGDQSMQRATRQTGADEPSDESDLGAETDAESMQHATRQTGTDEPSDETSESDLSDEIDADPDDQMPNIKSDGKQLALGPEKYEEIQMQVANDLKINVKHKAIKVPRRQTPFTNMNSAAMGIFLETLQQVHSAGYAPAGFGILADEWEDGVYPTHEVLMLGYKRKELTVSLPETVWFPRALAWAQALYVVNYISLKLDE